MTRPPTEGDANKPSTLFQTQLIPPMSPAVWPREVKLMLVLLGTAALAGGGFLLTRGGDAPPEPVAVVSSETGSGAGTEPEGASTLGAASQPGEAGDPRTGEGDARGSVVASETREEEQPAALQDGAAAGDAAEGDTAQDAAAPSPPEPVPSGINPDTPLVTLRGNNPFRPLGGTAASGGAADTAPGQAPASALQPPAPEPTASGSTASGPTTPEPAAFEPAAFESAVPALPSTAVVTPPTVPVRVSTPAASNAAPVAQPPSRAATTPVVISVPRTEPARPVVSVKPPVQAKPVAVKPIAAKPMASKPVAVKPVAARPVTAKPVTARPTAPRPVVIASSRPVARPATPPAAPSPVAVAAVTPPPPPPPVVAARVPEANALPGSGSGAGALQAAAASAPAGAALPAGTVASASGAPAPTTSAPAAAVPAMITQLSPTATEAGAPAPAPGSDALDAVLAQRQMAVDSVVLGPNDTAIFRSDQGFLVVSEGQTLPETNVLVKDITATAVTLTLGTVTKTLQLEKR